MKKQTSLVNGNTKTTITDRNSAPTDKPLKIQQNSDEEDEDDDEDNDDDDDDDDSDEDDKESEDEDSDWGLEGESPHKPKQIK